MAREFQQRSGEFGQRTAISVLLYLTFCLTLKFKLDHVTWLRAFRDSLSSAGWDFNLKYLWLPAMKISKATQYGEIVVVWGS